MSTNGFMQRRKGEELIRQRFYNLHSVIKRKQDEARKSLRDRLEGTTNVRALREEMNGLEDQVVKLNARISHLHAKITHTDSSIDQQVHTMTRELEEAITAMNARLADEERRLVEQLWVDSLSSDLKELLGKVPTATQVLTNGISTHLNRLNDGTPEQKAT